jgi:hypothetical protein
MPDDVLRGIDAPRPLPPHVRSALETRLLAPDELPALLRAAEAPRALPSDLRDGLRRQLVRRRPLPVWLVGAAAAAVLVTGAVVALPPAPSGAPTAQPQAAPAVSPGAPSPAPAPAPMGNAPAVEPAPPVPAPTPVPPPRPAPTAAAAPAAPGSGAAGSGSGSGPVAAGPQRGVTGVAPDEGPLGGGTRITLSGQDLARAVRVDVDGRTGSDLVIESDERISVLTPAAPAATQATIEVHLSTGEVYLVPAAFAYRARPSVTAVDPAQGPATGGNVVTVTGRDFTARTEVAFGDTAAGEVQVLSDTELRVVAPAHLPGRVALTVTTAGGRSNAVTYAYGP